jgi:hypothetical protein
LTRRKSNFAAGFLGSKCCSSKAATRLYIHFEWDRDARQLFASFGVNAGLDCWVQKGETTVVTSNGQKMACRSYIHIYI